MKLLFVRFLTGVIAATAFAACATSNAVIPAAQQHVGIPTNPALRSTATSPCKPPDKFWYFRGSCSAYSMKKSGTKVALDPYKGLTLTMNWPGDHPPQSRNSFVTGDAVGKGDITGTDGKGEAFPLYGSKKCIDIYFRRIRCIGTVLLYTVTANATSFEIGWDHAPTVTITNTKPYPGKTCQVTELLDVGKRGWLWMLWPEQGKPKGETLSIPYRDSPFSMPTNSVLILGVLCH